MRNPDRIVQILNKLEIIWAANPDWRFGQLLFNIGYTRAAEDFFNTYHLEDLFHEEDDRLGELLDAQIRLNGLDI